MATAVIPFSQRVIDAVQGTNEFAGTLPRQYRSMSERFLKTARLYIATCNHRDKLQKCTIGSVVTSILQAAKYGILIDGKQGHLVPFNTKVKDADGKERWESLAQFMPDYKGLINTAKRCGIIVDAYAEHVHEFDTFHRKMINGVWSCEYEPANEDRGQYFGTFAMLLFPDGRFKVEYMCEEEINEIRERSKSKDNGPWVDSFGEMARKTVIKRALKTYLDDPELMELMGYDDEVAGIETIDTTATPVKGIRKSAPLAITASDESVSFSEMQEQREQVPVEQSKRKQERQEQKAIDPIFVSMFAHCKDAAQCEQTRAEALVDDPTLEMATDFERAYKQKIKEVG